MAYVLALDQGTTSSRAILFDERGHPVAHAQSEFTQHYPNSGWVEHDPDDILTTQLATATDVLVRARIRPRDIAAIGITNQRETTLVWDRETGKPVYNAIVWQDRRTAPLCRQLVDDGVEPMVREKTGLVLDSYFSGTKIAWILDNVGRGTPASRAGQARLRHRRQLADLEPDQRQAPRHRPDQRQPDFTLQHRQG